MGIFDNMTADEAAAAFLAGKPTVQRTKAYFLVLMALGHATMKDDGELTGRASDGTIVHLGHILEHKPARDWAILGKYLQRCPLPKDW